MSSGIIDVQEVYEIRGRSQLTAMSITSVVSEYNGFTGSDIPTVGIYTVWATVDCTIKHNTAAGQTACTAENGLILNARVPVDMRIYKNDVISALSDSASGKVRFMLTKTEV